jgi:hypothetical protein
MQKAAVFIFIVIVYLLVFYKLIITNISKIPLHSLIWGDIYGFKEFKARVE